MRYASAALGLTLTFLAGGCLDTSLKLSAAGDSSSDATVADRIPQDLASDTKPQDTGPNLPDSPNSDLFETALDVLEVAPDAIDAVAEVVDAVSADFDASPDGLDSADINACLDSCGNSLCQPECDESEESCFLDCCVSPNCGNGKCKTTGACPENSINCPEDCPGE